MGVGILRYRNHIFITLLVVSSTLGNLFVAIGMNAMPEFRPSRFICYTAAILTNTWFISGVILLILWMIAQLSMFTWADLSYVMPMTSISYVLTAILGKFLLAERVSAERWAGIALISFGVILVAETPVWTHATPPKEEEE
jgi:drug/metabolite transporter (DMT)-like permease